MRLAIVLKILLGVCLVLSTQAVADDKDKGKSTAKGKLKPTAADPVGRGKAVSPTSGGQDGQGRSARSVNDGGQQIRLEDGSKVKSYTFGTMDLEGKLKTPQLLYFLNRVKVELDSTTDARRSFMKELQDTAEEKGL